jgi:intracellular multiplication protein IcmE
MTLPDRSQSLAIDAYAVDENTAQASLTGEVNHHYILRYGSLFAAAFLQGFGSYFSDRNDDNVVCSKDSVICVNNQLNNSARDAAFSGLGQVGTALSSSVQQQFSRPITVELARGTGLGVLFMRDVEPSDSAAGQNASLTADKSPTIVKG